MPEVKPIPRKERARATRGRIVAAAYELFAERGFTGTTMPDVAAAAGVAVQTVYLVFRTKTALLDQVYAAAVLGADEVRPLDSEWFRAAITEREPRRSLQIMLAGVLSVSARVAPLAATMDTVHDDEIKALRAEKEALRRQVHRAFVEHLKKMGALRPGLTIDRATDLFLGLASPAMYHAMTADHGWVDQQWASQLLDLLAHGLLRSG
ncbi:MAG: TetR/AcrR family transcriptional regulator [Micromonosporaceae bacterium]